MINPIMRREVITLFRRKRTYVWVSLYLAFLIYQVGTMWPGSSRYYYGGNANFIFDIILLSRRLVTDILYMIFILISILLPSYMATTFTREKEENILITLATTPLTILDIIIGKVQVGAFYTLFFLILTLPIFGALYRLGGFKISEIVQCYIIIFIVSFAQNLWAMTFSVISSTSYKAIGRTYAFFFLLLFVAGMLMEVFKIHGIGYIFDSAYINPFICINYIFFGNKYYSYSSNLTRNVNTDLVFGFFYPETLQITGFYSIVSLFFLLLIFAIYKRFSQRWM